MAVPHSTTPPPLLVMLSLLLVGALSAAPPNIVLFLTDDQDQMLGGSFPVSSPGGATPMPQTKELMADAGATATNMFIHTPICCPSRSELLSGRYFHNIKRTVKPSPQAPSDIICMHVNESKVNNATFAKYLAEDAGYSVGMFGKYLNNVPKEVPPGYDAWLANGGGDYVAPQFNTQGLAWAGIPDGSWRGTEDNYTTAVVGNLSLAWIRKTVAEKKPFFAYIAPKAAHEPFIPAPWHLNHWEPSWPKTEPTRPY
eukprot:TRINITY_DN5929_c0_g1_i1.p2 TRINITY_DN5929_c0_g1~~TRINITY_DN5929_c0_g1_i1.p2  ORF type:complete len:255 (+),score=60.56 TRINITY_DN5929_c0_g1_i1:177-941(+)